MLSDAISLTVVALVAEVSIGRVDDADRDVSEALHPVLADAHVEFRD